MLSSELLESKSTELNISSLAVSFLPYYGRLAERQPRPIVGVIKRYSY
jgi:hypothetical protein